MNRFFYLRMAATNLKKNKETYLPYMLSAVGSVFIYFVLVALIQNPGMANMPASDSLKMLFTIGQIITGIFAVIFIFYTNSFLMKRRKKELALYGILGLEKRHVALILFNEMSLMAIITIAMGCLIGTVFGKLFFLLLLKISDFSRDSVFKVTTGTVLNTVILFLIIFFVTFIWNYIQVKIASPVSLMRDESAGEKEPKSSIIITIIGIVTLAAGYFIASSSQSMMSSITNFLGAVILVMIGTYALFTSGTVGLLKGLKKNNKFYYKAKNFISTSNMIYRMKKNAVGLANICLLSTAVIITISCTVLVYVSREDLLTSNTIADVLVTVPIDNADRDQTLAQITALAEQNGVVVNNQKELNFASISLLNEGNDVYTGAYSMMSFYSVDEMMNAFYNFHIMTQEEFNRILGTNLVLTDHEALVIGDEEGNTNEIMLNGFNFSRYTGDVSAYDDNQILKEYKFLGGDDKNTVVVVKTEEQARVVADTYIQQRGESTGAGPELFYDMGYNYSVKMDLSGSEEAKVSFSKDLETFVYGQYAYGQVDSLITKRMEWNGLYGGLLFLGITMGLLFISAFVLIIYFKQVSEGYEDRQRFNILRKVGMDKRDIRKTIYKQIKMVFILPIATAFIHVVAAFPILSVMLMQFGLTDKVVMAIGIAAVCALFGIFYIGVYLITAKAYRNILKLS